MTRTAFHEAVDGESLPEKYQLQVAYDADEIKAVDTVRRVVKFVISMGTPDRHNDIVHVDGWNLKNFHKGGRGPVLWSHSHRTPALAGANVRVQGKKLVAEAFFPPDNGNHPLSSSVFELIEGDFGVKGASVGFMPEEWTFNEKRGGFDFLKQELLEFSVVNVGAHPDALRLGMEAGVNMDPIIEQCERALTATSGEGLWIPKDKALAIVKTLGSGMGVRFFDMSTQRIEKKVASKVDPDAGPEIVGEFDVEELDDDELRHVDRVVTRAVVSRGLDVVVEVSTDEISKAVDKIEEDTSTLERVAELLDGVNASLGAINERLDTLEGVKGHAEDDLVFVHPEDHEEKDAADGGDSILFLDDEDPRVALDLDEVRSTVRDLLAPRAKDLKRAFTNTTGRVLS